MTTAPRLVAVVMGDDTLRESLCRAIRVDGHRATPFSHGDAVLASRDEPSLAIVELGSTGIDAPPLCRRLRERAVPPAIIAVVSSEEALDAAREGVPADEFLAQPFSVREVLLRVKALLRRAALVPGAPLAWEDRPLMLGPLTVDPVGLTAQWNGKDAGLTVTEFMLVHALVRRAGVVKTRDQLMQEVFPDHAAVTELIETHIRRIRERFERIDPRFDALEQVHGAGYRYRTGK
jgi:two-component system response regulator ChvI